MTIPASDEPLGQLIASIQLALEQLTDQVSLFRLAVDELATEIQWRNNQERSPMPLRSQFVLTSMPLDPLAADWQINRTSSEQLPIDLTGRSPTAQQHLFD